MISGRLRFSCQASTKRALYVPIPEGDPAIGPMRPIRFATTTELRRPELPLSAATASRPTFPHVHRSAARVAAALSRSRCSLSVKAHSIARAISRTSLASNNASSQSITSGSDELFEQIVMQPHAAASATGKPKPSSSDGITDSRAAWYSATISSSVTVSVKTTSCSVSPIESATSRQRARTTGTAAHAMTSWCDARSSLAIEPQARINLGVFLRSSPPVTATTRPRASSTPLSIRRSNRDSETNPSQNCGSTAAPTT